MDQPAPRHARLTALRDRWLSEPLTSVPPPLTDDEHPPTNCNELMRHPRVTVAFTPPEEVREGAEGNTQHFGVPDPAATLAELTRQFETAVSGRVDPEVVKKGFVVLDTLREDSLIIAGQYTTLLAEQDVPEVKAGIYRSQQAAHTSVAQALTQAEAMVEELASELGLSLPVNRGVRPKR